MNDLLVGLLSHPDKAINLSTTPPAVIMMVGLQGSGKTTSAAKLAKFLTDKLKKRVLLTSCDVYRPAAQQQLARLAEDNNITSTEVITAQRPIEIAKRSLTQAQQEGFDVLIVDTAGRLHSDAELMNELKEISAIVNPVETMLVVDAMIGQDAINVAQQFNQEVNLSALILTRLDGDARGGAALSISQITNLPIKYVGMGEKIEDWQEFHPDRIVSRILGMGDIVSLVEKAKNTISESDAKKVANKMLKGQFNFNDLAEQIKNMKKMGGMMSMMSMIPGINKIKDKLNPEKMDEKQFDRLLAIISSMTPKERQFPDWINGSRRKRIAAGSGTKVEDVNKLLKMLKNMKKMMKKMNGFDMKSLSKLGLGKLFS
jgi:signal recognition particle subunit SRP54